MSPHMGSIYIVYTAVNGIIIVGLEDKMSLRKLFIAASCVTLAIVFTSCADKEDADVMTLDILSFRAEVLEFDSRYSLRNDEALLFVYSLTSVGGHPVGDRYFINRNDFVVALDANGETILYYDIPHGSVVDITYYGLVLESKPAIIPQAVSIQIVD